MTRFILWALLCCVGFAPSSRGEIPEQGTPIISVPFTITKPGIYVLRRSLTFTRATGAAITINADKVTLDLGGRTLTSTTADGVTSAAVGISSTGHNNLTVRHGKLFNFVYGVMITPGAAPGRVLLENVECEGSTGSALQVSNGDFVEVQNCRVRNTGVAEAINVVWGILADGRYSRVVGNEVIQTLATGANARGIQVAGLSSFVGQNRVINSAIGLSSLGIIVAGSNSSPSNAENFAVGNTVAGWSTGLIFVNGALGKYQDNLTANCTTAFLGGTLVGDNN